LIADQSLKVTKETKERLEKLKVIPDERINSLILRLIEFYEEKQEKQQRLDSG